MESAVDFPTSSIISSRTQPAPWLQAEWGRHINGFWGIPLPKNQKRKIYLGFLKYKIIPLGLEFKQKYS